MLSFHSLSFNRWTFLAAGLGLFILTIAFHIFTFFAIDAWAMNTTIGNVFVGLSFVYLSCLVLIAKLLSLPGNKPTYILLPYLFLSILVLILCINFLRLDYSRSAISFGSVIVFILAYASFIFLKSKQRLSYAVLPFGFYEPVLAIDGEQFQKIESPSWPDGKVDGLIVDGAALIGASLSPDWQRFIANTLASGAHVLSSIDTYESLTGKSPLEHYSEFSFGELKPSNMYIPLKRGLESALIIATAPLSLCLLLLTMIAIKLDSKGPLFFTQQRVGKGAKEFTLYKLRSMTVGADTSGAQFASANDRRVTRVGKVIRKLRIDEVPQLFNVLIGDMALVGPRPEQASFVARFEQEIPMYSFRHVVRPGITGWAQVMQGYADDDDSTREKLSYDFFYVKNMGIWLDFLVVLKTLKTILTGFGAR